MCVVHFVFVHPLVVARCARVQSNYTRPRLLPTTVHAIGRYCAISDRHVEGKADKEMVRIFTERKTRDRQDRIVVQVQL